MSEQSVHPEIADAIATIRRLRSCNHLVDVEERALARARLKVAAWACKQEGLPITEGNLASILGSYSNEALKIYRKRVLDDIPVDSRQAASPAPVPEPEQAEEV